MARILILSLCLNGLLSLSYFALVLFMSSLCGTEEFECILCESEPVSDHPYLQFQAQAKRHLINYLYVHPINVNVSIILIQKCVEIIQ